MFECVLLDDSVNFRNVDLNHFCHFKHNLLIGNKKNPNDHKGPLHQLVENT